MSRIYKPVSSRSGVCLTERNLGIITHSGGMIKIRAGGQFAPAAPKIQTEPSVPSVQHQVEELCLREQEVQKKNDGEAFQNQNACQDQNKQIKTIFKPSPEPKVQTKPKPNPNPTATAPAPLFTIRSASVGTGKRGTTFTITPRRSAPSLTPPSSVTTPKVPSFSSTTADEPTNTPDLNKKRYPTAEEIEVIGGYQKLERSCLMKNRGAPKMVRVSFDDTPVCVCTYPPEESVMSEQEHSDEWRRTEEKPEEMDEEACMDEDTGAGSGLSRVLRVDESSHRRQLNLIAS